MALSIAERKNSRSGGSNRRQFRYLIRGAANDTIAYAFARGNIPTVHPEGLDRNDIQIEQLADNPPLYEAIAEYTRRETQTASLQYSFDITLENVKIKRSLETIESQANDPEETPPDFHGAINVQSDGQIEGTDASFPIARFSYSLQAEAGFVDESFAAYLEEFVGAVNSVEFRGRPPGEVMFLGATGRQTISNDDNNWSLDFHFLRRPNRQNVAIGDMTFAEIQGFDYLWAYFAESVSADEKHFIVKPTAAYIERISERKDLNLVFIRPLV